MSLAASAFGGVECGVWTGGRRPCCQLHFNTRKWHNNLARFGHYSLTSDYIGTASPQDAYGSKVALSDTLHDIRIAKQATETIYSNRVRRKGKYSSNKWLWLDRPEVRIFGVRGLRGVADVRWWEPQRSWWEGVSRSENHSHTPPSGNLHTFSVFSVSASEVDLGVFFSRFGIIAFMTNGEWRMSCLCERGYDITIRI